MKIIDKVWIFDYLMEVFMIMTMVCGQILLTNSLNPYDILVFILVLLFIVYFIFYLFYILLLYGIVIR